MAPAFPSVPVQQNPRSHKLGRGWECTVAAAVEFAEEVAEQVVEEEPSSALEEWESCGDVDAGRLAGETGPCTPWTVNPTLMMQEARLLTCREVSDNARRRMVLRR